MTLSPNAKALPRCLRTLASPKLKLTTVSEQGNRSGLGAAESWGRPETLADHFNRHGADFGATSAENYAQQASRFLQESQARGLPTKIDANGIIRVYDPATNTFGAYNPNGTTATFFKPTRGQSYWNSQPGVAQWEPKR
jgi:pyocin large subunit-like protein